jgi:hypothetical protein
MVVEEKMCAEIYRDYAFKIAASTAQADLEIKVPLEYAVVVLHKVVAVDYTSSPGFVKLGVLDGKTYHWYHIAASPAAGTTVYIPQRVLVVGGDKIVARFQDATEDDELWLWINGLAYKKAEG